MTLNKNGFGVTIAFQGDSMWSRRFWLILCTKGLASWEFQLLIFATAVILLIFGPLHFCPFPCGNLVSCQIWREVDRRK